MAKNYSNRNRKRKALIAMLCALSVTCTGLAAACAPNEEDEPSTAVTAKEDTQVLKNGNFEHFDIPDKAIHLIKNVNSWTLGGDSSVMSGIIGTTDSEWAKLTDTSLAEKLDLNNDLTTDNEDYVNYNSMRSRDILYKDTYAATFDGNDADTNFKWVTGHTNTDGVTGYEGYFGIEGNDEDGYTYNGEAVYKETLVDSKDVEYVEFFYEKDNTPVRKTLISNPETHWGAFKEVDGEYFFGEKQAYVDENGNYYFDEDLEENPVGNVLMIHNASTDTVNNGLQQYYTSTSITLEAHTSAEISLWVKTSDLRFNKGYTANSNEYDKGAFIEVVQTVASTTLDSFEIKAINTEKILENTTDENNGWIQYTVYVNACDFASTTIQLKLGLGGDTEDEKVTGYAFFDDVQVTKYRELSDENCSYTENESKLNANNSCSLTSEEDEKIFYADVDTRNSDNRNAYDFYYLIDLASEAGMGGNYSAINFGTDVQAGLTTSTDTKGVEYAAATEINSSVISGVSAKTQSGLNLPKDVKARPTNEDLITVFNSGYTFGDSYKYHSLLNNLTGDNAAPELLEGNSGNTLVIFSAWGAPYTATITDNSFTVPHASSDGKDGYLLVSFWVKTSDLDGNTAATVKIYEINSKTNLPDENSVQTLTVDTTDITTDFEDEEDIYNGWVQCFFFIKNDSTEKDDSGNYVEKSFKIDFSFGETDLLTATSFESGYAAIANLQVLTINKEIYNLASADSYTALFSFSNESDNTSGTVYDEATGTDDINNGIAGPSSYTGANGANVLGSLTVNSPAPNAGLINRDVFNDNDSAMTPDAKLAVLKSFLSSATSWDEVFGKNCYQPLIIINNLREYASLANANENNFQNYWIKNDDGTFTKVADLDNPVFDKDEKYYSVNKVANYGFIGEEKTVSSNGSEVISVRVKVAGDAVAYIYLIDTDTVDGPYTGDILNFTTPAYTYWYDDEGNVLDEELNEDWTTAEHRSHIIYTLRDDGLYDGADGKLYGNLHNLIKSYKDSKYELNRTYYDADGNVVDYDDLKDGVDYYKSSDISENNFADHYLCSSDGTHVYEYIDGKYYYVEITTDSDGNTTEVTNLDNVINNFDIEYARYTNPDIDEKLFVTVTAEDCDPANGLCDENGWVTVNFVITTGSEDKHYRLELWSGDRNETGVDENNNYDTGAVVFDYHYGTVSDTRLAAYEAEIIQAYNRVISEVAPELFEELESGTGNNIRSYEKLLESENLSAEKLSEIKAKMADYAYVASYYTFTLYDASSYIPFNATTAGDGETGYNYDPSLYTEQLAYLEYNDAARHEKNIFVDYTAVDQSITLNTVTDDEETEDEDDTNAAELGLYISSIVLVVVLLITLISLLITQYVRKLRKAKNAKNSSKNVYRKRDRYVKKLRLVKEEIVDNEASEATEDVPAENEATETVEETVEPTSEEPVSEEPASENEPSDKTDDNN